jgi:tetratricopeptide (TPR) repeat protein
VFHLELQLPPQVQQIRDQIRDGEFEDALNLIEQMEEELEANSSENLLSTILKLLKISIWNEQRNYDEALSEEDTIAKQVEKCNNWTIKCDYFNYCSITSLAFQGIETAKTHLLQSEKWIKTPQPALYGDRKEREAMVAKIKGIIATIQGDNTASHNFYLNALSIYKSLNYYRDCITLYNDLGESFRLMGNFQKAEELYKEGLELAKKHDMLNTLPYYYNNLGEVHRLRGDLNSALKYYEQALEASAINVEEKYFCVDFSSIGQIYWEKGHVEKAIQFLEDNLDKCETFGSIINACQIIFILFQIQLDQNHIQQATDLLQKFKQLAEKSDIESIRVRYNLAHALLLKTNLRSRYRIASEDILLEIIQNPNTDNEIRIIALLNLCELLLIEFNFSNDPEILPEIENYLDQLNKYTMKQHSYWLLAELYLVRSKLALAKKKLTEARRFLTQAQYIADEHEFSQLAIRISNEHDRVLKQIPIWSQLQDADISLAQKLESHIANPDKNPLSSLASETESPENKESDEDPMLFTIIKEEGTALFSYPFNAEWGFDENLFSGFLTAFNQFSGELFSESLDRANFGQYTILMEKVHGFTMCYVFKGPTYRAQKKFNRFLKDIPNEATIWQRLLEAQNSTEFLSINKIPGIEKVLIDYFRQKSKSLGQN